MTDRTISFTEWHPTERPPEGDVKRRVLAESVMGGGIVHVPAFTVTKAPEWFSVWSEPVPPGPNALTVENLRLVAALVAEEDVSDVMEEEWAAIAVRLKEALAALGNGGTE